MNVPLLDLKAQYQSIRAEIEPAVREVFESQYFILGPQVTQCEQAVAAYSNCAHGVGVSSGTDALLLALMSAGIGSGDEVITTPYTFFATAGSIARLGARPVFVDIDPQSFNLDVKQLTAAITARTRAIIPVHLYGQMADMQAVMTVARQHDLIVIEDAAQAIGAQRAGQRAGSIGHYGCFSFFPSKNLGGAGDGGMVVTQDENRATEMKVMRVHGMEPKYYHQFIGGNFRLDALQAAVVSVKLRHLDAWTAARQRNAAIYTQLLAESGLVADAVVTPPPVLTERHIFNQYVVRVDRRDQLRDYLNDNQIATEVYYPCPLHLQRCFASLDYREGAFPESEKAAAETVALPIYPELSPAQLQYVVETMVAFYRN